MQNRHLIPLAALVLAGFFATPAGAQDYLISQAGFSGGGTLSGGFSATDSDQNGVLDASFDAISGFSLSFSGDSLVPDFTLGQADLVGLVYHLGGGGFLGDDGAVGTGEGLMAGTGDLFSTGLLYQSGIGPTGLAGGSVTDFASMVGSQTSQPIHISAVPEPRTWALLLAGLGLTWLVVQRRA